MDSGGSSGGVGCVCVRVSVLRVARVIPPFTLDYPEVLPTTSQIDSGRRRGGGKRECEGRQTHRERERLSERCKRTLVGNSGPVG